MRKFKYIVFILLVSFAWNLSLACTSAIVSGKITKDGRPLLWKHRDTGDENNKVERIPAKNGNMEYVALYNTSDKKNKEAWMGMNTSGFAIMNTASYNLKDDTISKMDQEGLIMAEALEQCKTVDDFENFLKNHKKPLRVEANFGVIDAQGNGAYFETNNWTYKKYDLADAPNGILTRTNYSYSGKKDKGYGYVRENNEKHLLEPFIKSKTLEPSTFTEFISRTFYNSILNQTFNQENSNWIIDQDFIPRNISTATCVIEGIKVGEDPSLTTMWIGLGYPPCSEIRAAFLGENGVPQELQGIKPNGHSPLCDIVVERKNEVFPINRDNGSKYVHMNKLYNKENTGYCQKLIPLNLQYYKDTYKQIDIKRSNLKNK